MAIEDQLRERLRKVEALLAGAGTPGERQAASAALERLKARLAEASRHDVVVELQFSLPDQWSVRLFVALCRRYGFRPYRYCRQRLTTVMVRAPKRAFEEMVWRQFCVLQADLFVYIEQITTKLISDALEADTADADEVAEPLALR